MSSEPGQSKEDIQQADQGFPFFPGRPSLQPRRSPYPFLVTWALMFCLWVVLSGRFDAFHLTCGAISCWLVAYFSSDLLFISPGMKGLAGICARFTLYYIPWLLYQIVLANLHVAYLVFHPRMMELIDPQVIKFQSRLKSELSLVTFANSITLTPGTITVSVTNDGQFKVHAIDQKCGQSLPGEMEVKIARVFGE